MAGTKEGGKKAAATMLDKYGADYYRNMGSKGGKACVSKGFGKNPELAREAGKKGGHNSRRGKAIK